VADPRCVRCGKPVAAGYLCDACQFALVSISRPQAGDAFVQPVKARRVDPFALFTVAVVLVIGLVALLEWPKLQQTMTNPVASRVQPSDSNSDSDDSSPTSQQFRTMSPNSAESKGTTLPPPADTSSLPPIAGTKRTRSSTTLPTKQFAESSDYGHSVAQDAQKTLELFLADYCHERELEIGGKTFVSSVTWWPWGAGVIVELDENGGYRQGTAQYARKEGWKWLIRPDPKPEPKPTEK